MPEAKATTKASEEWMQIKGEANDEVDAKSALKLADQVQNKMGAMRNKAQSLLAHLDALMRSQGDAVSKALHEGIHGDICDV